MKSAVILAAGPGQGAWPYTTVRQKAALPIVNVPMVRRLALDLLAVGIEDVVTVTGYRAESVRACLGDLNQVRFVDQNTPAGPVDALLCGLDLVSGGDVLVCAGDIVTTPETFQRAVGEFERRHADALLVTADCPPDAPHWTTVEVEDGLVTGIRGHGARSEGRWGGIALAKTELLGRYALRNPGIMPNVHVGDMPSLEGDVAYTFELMRADGIDVHVSEAERFLVDVDRPWHIVEANRLAARYATDRLEKTVLAEGASIDDGAHIDGDARLMLGPGARIGRDVHVRGSLILGPGSQLTTGAILGGRTVVGEHTRCEHYCSIGGDSVLGSECVVSHGAEFSGVMFDTVYLYHYCSISGLAGCNVDIGAATVCGTWRFDNGVRTQVVKGHKEMPLAYGSLTYIGDYCRTGVNAMFMPGVKVGCYSCVGPGAIVFDDVPERTLLMPKQEQTTRSWGPERYGW